MYASLIIVSATLLGVVVGVWRLATENYPKVETVHVLVASRSLTTRTAFTQGNVDELTAYNDIPRNAIPEGAKIILNKEELVGKRLLRATHQGEFFYVADIRIETQILLEVGQDIMSIPMEVKQAVDGGVVPGSSIDVVASYIDGTDRKDFTLIVDKQVLAIDAESDLTVSRSDPEMRIVSFFVDQKQALLIPLAYQLNCKIEFKLRHPDAPKPDYDYDKTLARLRELAERREWRIAPAPRAKAEE